MNKLTSTNRREGVGLVHFKRIQLELDWKRSLIFSISTSLFLCEADDMLAETVLASTISSLPGFQKFVITRQKSVRAQAVSCLRRNRELNGLYKSSSRSELEGHNNAEISNVSSSGDVEASSNIWKLFREAQENILLLNKQRLIAVKELKRTISEKQMLLDKIDQLEMEKQASASKDQLSMCWELLLRIDSMVLTGKISTAEAYDIRRLVMDHKVSLAGAFTDVMQKSDAELLEELRQFSDRSKKNGLHIVHICTEMSPLASFGAGASYVTGLSRALQKKGNLVEVILPKYASLDLDEVQGLREVEGEYYSYFNGQRHGNRIWTGVLSGIGVTLIEPLSHSSYFNRERAYGYPDDFERFMYFSRASLDYIVKAGKQPDVLHIHNWETAIVGPLFWEVFVKQGLGNTRILLTCHDIHSQCLEQPEKLALCGLDPARLHRPDRLQDNTKTYLVNILKGGIVYSNKVVLMSSVHSKGRIIHSLSHGMESTLNMHKDKLVISPCGFDCSTWNPAKDSLLPENYSEEDMNGKAVCRIALQKRLGMVNNSSLILVGCFLSEMSDVDMENMRAVVWNATRRDVQFVFMGTGKTTKVDRMLESFQKGLEDKKVALINRYDEALSHLVFAGSDIILCQSFHDPVYQVPLKALKYGAAPVALTSIDHRFRQFADNDFDVSKFSRFISSTFGSLSLSQALDEIKDDPSKWRRKLMDAMSKDFSWDAECFDIHISAYTDIKKL